MSPKRAIRRGALSKRWKWHVFGEREEQEETRGRTELGRETARKLGKLSGKLACVELKKYHAGEEWRVFKKGKKQKGGALNILNILPIFFSQELNLSYQDLGDPFQQENFLRILRRLIRVEKLQLVDNSLTNLSSVRLPRYEPHCPDCATASSPVGQVCLLYNYCMTT